jgi:hypothetical protein
MHLSGRQVFSRRKRASRRARGPSDHGGYRAIMYAGGLISVMVYLANLNQVRTLREEPAR